MRTVSLLALGLLAIAALLLVISLMACGARDYSTCTTMQLGAIILILVGSVLALIATIVNAVRTAKRRQWTWLACLVACLLVPLPMALLLDIEIGGSVYSDQTC